ncbi:uncharacterized protein LOC135465651 [Liolophura sinensis]|uniref:uncharacterized protein LOC135465651 n=1 Tax=Liolophura sinensis TaxID=3198878 RepID=UPI003159234D
MVTPRADVTFRPTPSGPVVNDCPPVCQLCDNMAEVSKRFGGGDIAGAVLGGACGGALMALLFTFIILHCTGYTLTGSKENRVTEARRYVQQSHPPRQHHSDPTVTQEPERDATINEDPSCAMAEVSPDYYNVQQDSTGYWNTNKGNVAGYYNTNQGNIPDHFTGLIVRVSSGHCNTNQGNMTGG